MGYKTPEDIAEAGIATGAMNAQLAWDNALVGGVVAGAFEAEPVPAR